MAKRAIRHPLVERWALRAKTASDWIVARLVFGTLAVLRLLPAERSIAAAGWLGERLAPVLPRSALARRNMALAFPDRSAAEIDELLRRMWGHVARTVAEYVCLDELFEID